MPVRAYHRELKGIADMAWAIDGTPADCGKLALELLLPEKPDIVISGINPGPNLGTDVMYSGTVAAAAEGFCFGCPAIAVSCTGTRRGKGEANFDYAADFIAKLCLKMAERDFKPKMLLNINVPGSAPEDIKGVRYTYMGWRWYADPFGKRIDPHGKDYYWLQGTFDDRNCGIGSDVEACNQGFISITPLQIDQTDYGMLEAIKADDLIRDIF